MRPRREPGAAGLPEDPGLTPGAMADGPARKGGVSGSGFTEVFRIDVRPLLHAHRVQRDPARQAGRDALPHVHRHRLPRREPAPRSELGERLLDSAGVEKPGGFLGYPTIEALPDLDPERRLATGVAGDT